MADREPPWSDSDGAVCYGPRGLPPITIGWDSIAHAARCLTIPDGDKAGDPWILTPEQMHWWLWFFALDHEDEGVRRGKKARWLFRRSLMRRLKGGGKDPLLALTASEHLIGPVKPVWSNGQWIGVRHHMPWIQLAAVTKEQTRTTTLLFPGMFPERTLHEYRVDIAKTVVYAPSETGALGGIEALTASPLAAEGPRPLLVGVNEPQNWFGPNGGHDMYKVLRRNAAKVGGRLVEFGNAHQPGQDSVMERSYNAYLKWRTGTTSKPLRLLYNAREASPETRLDDPASLRRGLQQAAGDAFWIDYDDVETEFSSRNTPPAEARPASPPTPPGRGANTPGRPALPGSAQTATRLCPPPKPPTIPTKAPAPSRASTS